MGDEFKWRVISCKLFIFAFAYRDTFNNKTGTCIVDDAMTDKAMFIGTQ